jgi:hypothetical protein
MQATQAGLHEGLAAVGDQVNRLGAALGLSPADEPRAGAEADGEAQPGSAPVDVPGELATEVPADAT